MRLLHTSDWHLGKKLFKLDRRQEHELFLNWLIDTIKIQKIDVLLMSGDVFDSPTPPHNALELFYDFLYRLSTETSVLSYFIAGNHDSGQLIDAPKALLKNYRVKVWGKLSDKVENHWETISIGNESIELCALPFFRSHEIQIPNEDILISLQRYFQNNSIHNKILMLHHLAGMYEAGGSEQVIGLTGVESIPTEYFKDFNYVALGHIHKPQKIKNNAYYSGSPLAMRFSEKDTKSVLTIDTLNAFHVEKIAIPTFRKITSIKTDLHNWRSALTKLQTAEGLRGVAEVDIALPSPQIGLTDEIRQILDSKNYDLLSIRPEYQKEVTSTKDRNKIFELSTSDLFKEFYLTKYSSEEIVPDDVLADFQNLLIRSKNEID